MKTCVLVILTLYVVTTVAWAQTKRKPAASSTEPPPQSENKMSPAFQEQGHRATDAIMRLPLIPSADHPEPGFEQRKLDTEKSIDEAKYKAQTAKDKEVLKLLRAAMFLIGAAEERHVLDYDWKPLSEAAAQCKLEIRAVFEPDDLSALGRKAAAEKTCLEKRDAVVKMWKDHRLNK